MSHLPQNYAKIVLKHTKAKDERREKGAEHGQESLRGVGYQSNRVSEKIRCKSIFNFRLEQRKYTENDSISIGAYNRDESAEIKITESRRILRTNARIRHKETKYLEYSIFINNLIRFFGYNPIIFNSKVKGFQMELNLHKTIYADDITNGIERNLKGVIFLLNSVEASIDSGSSHSVEGFALIAKTIQEMIDTDLQTIKDGVDYMFYFTKSLSIDNGGASC